MDLFKGNIPFDTPHTQYEATVWVYADNEFAGYPIFKYERLDKEGNVVQFIEKSPRDQVEICDGWIRGKIDFGQAPDKDFTSRFYLEGEGITAASLLVRPAKVDVFMPAKDGKTLMLNNFYLPKE